MRQTYDVIIIGAGIMGCSSALQLAKRGLKVAVFEKGTVGHGPTAAAITFAVVSAGMVLRWGRPWV